MHTESFPAAQFDHVTQDGDLVFTADGMPFLVKVDDTFERAVLEAKQIRSEKRASTSAHQHRSLPISQIQSLIRAGADPEHIAKQYNLSEVLVRRFASSIEAEKKYAIEQFLRVRAPKESKVRTLSELIDRTLAAARVRPESVEWKATRRGLEPWRISANFMSAGHRIHAEWSWNMHDNTVVCINNAAGKLIGEMNSTGAAFDDSAQDALAEALPSAIQLPGDSARSARIEQTVAAWNNTQTAASTRNTTQHANTSASVQETVAPSMQEPESSEPHTTSEATAIPSSNETSAASDVQSGTTESAQQSDQAADRNATDAQPAHTTAEEPQADAPNEQQTGESAASDEHSDAENSNADASEKRARSKSHAVPISALYPKHNRSTAKSATDTRAVSSKHADEPATQAQGDDETPTLQQPSVRKSAEHDAPAEHHATRHSGRATMPSWDEIMFGKDTNKH